MASINKDTISGTWNSLKGKIKQQWAKLSDDDLLAIEGNYDELKGRLQSKYGMTKDRVEQEVEEFKRNNPSPRDLNQ